MKKVIDLFDPEGQELIRKATEGRGATLCWYPSSGADLRHIRLLEKETSVRAPWIYLHSDMCASDRIGLWKAGEFASSADGTDMQFIGSEEVSLNKKIRESLSGVNKDVYSFDTDGNTGKVFLVKLQVNIKCKPVQVPILFFSAENFTFLVNVLLHHEIPIETLIHIQDGGPTGGSKIPMDFIYSAARDLGLKRVVCDKTPEQKTSDMDCHIHLLQRALCRDADFPGRMMDPLSIDEFRKLWKVTKIPTDQMPMNTVSPQGVKYWDWRLK